MAKFNGTLLKITIGGTAVELNQSVSMSMSTAEVGCTNKDSSGYEEFLPGTKGWTMTGSSFIDYAATEGFDEAVVAWQSGTAVSVAFTTTVSGDTKLSGTAYFTSIEPTGELDGTAQYTFNLKGSGTLTKANEA